MEKQRENHFGSVRGTGSWSRPYKEAGYDVRVITLPEYDVLTYNPPDNVLWYTGRPALHRIFCLELQGRGKGEKPEDGLKKSS